MCLILRLVAFSFTVVTLIGIHYAVSIAIASVLFGLSSDVTLSTVLATIGAMGATLFIAPAVLAISGVAVEKVCFTASKVSQFFREKKE